MLSRTRRYGQFLQTAFLYSMAVLVAVTVVASIILGLLVFSGVVPIDDR